WNETINRNLAAFLAHFDIELIGTAAESQEPAEFQRADLRAGAELAYRVGREAFERAPDADALFIGGGAWFSDPAAAALEREFGKPVITSLNGAVRGILKALGRWGPFPKSTGRVLEVEYQPPRPGDADVKRCSRRSFPAPRRREVDFRTK